MNAVALRRFPLVILGWRRDVAHAVLDAWLRAALRPTRGVS